MAFLLFFGSSAGSLSRRRFWVFSMSFMSIILNSTLLVLILKNRDAMDIKDLWPLNLVGGLYKILAKDLAN